MSQAVFGASNIHSQIKTATSGAETLGGARAEPSTSSGLLRLLSRSWMMILVDPRKLDIEAK